MWIGNFPLTYYIIVYIIGFLLATYLLLQVSKKKEIKITKAQVYMLMLWGIIGLIIGARIFHILFWGWSYYLADPIKMLYIWQGGVSFHGGLIGVLIAGGIYCKIKKINFWKVADLFAFLGVLMPVFSRTANFINQEVVGTVTSAPWCFKFKYHRACRHPVQLYAAAGRLILFFVMIYWHKGLKKYKDGLMFWIFILVVGVGRFILDFWRRDFIYFGLKAGQWLSIPMILIGSYVLYKHYKKDIRRILKKI